MEKIITQRINGYLYLEYGKDGMISISDTMGGTTIVMHEGVIELVYKAIKKNKSVK